MRDALAGLSLLVIWLFAPSMAAGVDRPAGGASLGKIDLATEEMVVCAAVRDRVPAGVADTFPSDIFGVYCYTRLVGARGGTTVKHVWFHGETKMGEISLPVRSLPWRTWSIKEMREDWKGDWRVDLVASDGTVIASKKFFMK